MKARSLPRYALMIAAILTALAGAGPVEARTVYVSPSGNDANNGSSWAASKLTVQAGLNTAVAGDQVWVAAGTYVKCITLVSSVALYGGFEGNETNLAQRNWVVNTTILDGNGSCSVVTAPSGATTSTRVDGFTIRNGTGTLLSTGYDGGGIYCSGSSPAISNNIVAFNSSGLYNTGGTPTLRNNCVYNPAGANYSGLSAGTGDISVDRQLLVADYGEVHLKAGSPCIDAGLAPILFK